MTTATKTKLTNEVALRELEKIRIANDGVLQAEDVVEAASDESNPLHGQFEWEDSKAAANWRIQQARQLINTVVVIVPHYSKPVTAFVSLQDDRMLPGGGYRTIIDVMSDAALKKQLLANALKDLEHWQEKYKTLKELEPVFAAIGRLKKKKK